MKHTHKVDLQIEEGENIKGHVKIKWLRNTERLKYLDQSGLDLAAGTLKEGSEIEFSADLMDLAVKQIEEVKLEYMGNKIGKVENLEFYSFGMTVLSDVAQVLLRGPVLEKKS